MQGNLSELCEELQLALTDAEVRHAYRRLRFVLSRAVDIALRESPVQFSGLFAKTNYLLVEHKAQSEFMQSFSATRSRIRHQNEADETQLRESLPYDVKNLALFISIVIPDVEIPENLSVAFPKGSLMSRWASADARYLRVIVQEVDDRVITATTDGESATCVYVLYNAENQYLSTDYSYLKPLLKAGTQLNLVRPRQEDDGLLRPEIIIFEPDYLIDISSIASAFKEYGVTPLTNLLRKISPNKSTKATLLGDFASQLLDEELHGLADREYADSIAEFCRQRALAMASCDDLDASFHTEARRQKHNIHKAIAEDLPSTISEYKPEDVLLEPSFVSEMLGIQGRMDFLQGDFHVLIEQKSGKAAFVPGQQGFEKPALSTPHYVQILLYRALLHYGFDVPNEQIRPLLLYSKYDRPLLQTDSAPRLLHEAICLRNQLVWLELHLADEGFGLLASLKPNQLNKSGLKSKLWLQYTEPEIAGLLAPIQSSSSLERSYYLRMLRFVQREHVLSKIGNKRKENSGFAARWHDSLEEKIQAGNIYDRLSLFVVDEGTDIERIEVGFSDASRVETANFRVGDIVILFPYQLGREPDCRASMLHRASIEEITSEGMTLRLRAPQTNRRAFETRPGWAWAVEHDFMESSYAALYRGIHAFLSANQERKDLILSQRQPMIDETKTLSGDYGKFNELSLKVKQARELFLIVGPPGTGKTSFGMLNTLMEELLEPGASVAVMAFTNRAVDEICSKLVDEGIDFVRIGSEISCDQKYLPFHLNRKIGGLQKISDIREFIRRQRVVVGTTTAFNSSHEIFSLRRFSLAIIDEASQILEPHLLGLLSARHGEVPAIEKIVMIGDHKQLPAVVQQTPAESKVDNAALQAIGLTDCRLSLFERLLATYRHNPAVVSMLCHQGRMHEQIADFPNHHFYDGQLACVPLPHQVESSNEKRVQFIDVPRPDNSISDKVNLAEAEVIAQIVANVYNEAPESFDPTRTLGIIVPYRNQIAAVRSAIANAVPALSEAMPTIDTVERFQGSQREVIIYGFTVQRPYQLDFLTDNCFQENGKTIDRKLNVVMTRAMNRLFLIGNARLLQRIPLFAELIKSFTL